MKLYRRGPERERTPVRTENVAKCGIEGKSLGEGGGGRKTKEWV